MHARVLFPFLFLFALAALLLSLLVGSVAVEPTVLLTLFDTSPHSLSHDLVVGLRLPRALSAFVTGALLSLAGALMQVLVRNPLADPYVLGVSGGAAVGALGSMLAGLGGAWLTGSAFVGALLAMALVFQLARSGGSWTPTRLLLTGVVLAAGWGALISLILTVSPAAPLRGMLFWLMGDLGYSSTPLPAALVLVLGLTVCWPLARDLNILQRGEIQAGALGVATGRIQLWLYLLASLFTATAVVQAGSIGFVGLVIPHLIRLLGINDHRLLLPAAALAGGGLLVLADTLARSLLAPQQLPVGIITALLGVPLFLYLLQRETTRQ
ncbi:MAG: iron ABC transporter permease [Proteobacteria bacterium]|jgi:iron complex transport system permease protein|nr:iron ABC transporter permease [Pseudomonadota bacterium]